MKESARKRYGERDERYHSLVHEMEELRLSESAEGFTGYYFALNSIPPRSRVLEFGPASGYMTRYLKEQLDCDVTIIELDPECAASSGEFASSTFVGNIDDLGWVDWLGEEQFDVITFCDVLEHLNDPWNVLSICKNFLKDDGTVLCSIPNIAHHSIVAGLLENRFDYTPCGLLDQTHIRFFTSSSIMKMIEEAGFVVEKNGHTVSKDLFEESPFPWISSCAKSKAVFELQKTLANKEVHAIFQYVFQLKKREWTISQGHVGFELLPESDFISESDFILIPSVSNMVNQLKTETSEKINSLHVDLQKALSELETERVHLKSVVDSHAVSIWNMVIRFLSIFFVLKQWRKPFRKKHTIN